ncbi:MAG: hypothetical protein MJ175_01585 [Clostridia bacterium]|nr:hypothetical protein [Clostridia bacterium]
MKQTQRKTVCGLLALLTAAGVLASCGDAAKPSVETTPTSQAPVEEETTIDPNDRSRAKDNLPADLDFGGRTFTFFLTDPEKNAANYGGPEEQSGEIVEDAVLARNASVEERLNVDLNYFSETYYGGNDAPGAIRTLIMAGDSTYDAFVGIQWGVTKLITDNCFYNANDLQYVDFSQPWWNNFYMDSVSLGKDTRFFLVGDFDLDVLEYTRALFYNKALYANYYDDANGLYTEVLDGKWTLERMTQIVQDVFVDMNNDAKNDIDDQLGFITYGTMSSVDAFVYATDISFEKRTDDGLIELALINDKAVTLAEKLNALFWGPGAYSDMNKSNSDEMNAAFTSGRVMFLGNSSLKTAKVLRDMKDDFGFLPFPKLDEAQEGYHALVHDAVLLSSISAASNNIDMAGAVYEALNAETYRSVVPVWYATALKVKYSRDDISSQMIDLIHDSTTTSFVFAYNYALNDAGLLFRNLITGKSNDYISRATKVEKAAQKSLDKLISAFMENN